MKRGIRNEQEIHFAKNKISGKGKIFFVFAVFVLLINFTVAVRLPVVGSDTDAWGDILNEFLGVSMNSDGTLRNINNSVSGTTSVDGTLNISGNISVPTVCLNGTCQSSWNSLSSVPAGMIAPFNLSSCPTGWVLADGSNGTPDLRGIFIRGSGTNSILKYANGSYFSSTLGTYANDSFQGHWHSITSPTGTTPSSAAAASGGSFTAYGFGTVGLTSRTASYVTDGTNGEPRTGAETTPAYYSTIYCVKTTEDSATSNSIWTTSGNNVQLANASKNLNISGNLTLGLGQIAYNSSANKYYYYNTTSWVEIGSGASSSSTNYVNSIVESSNNSYGSYIKFIDGTMIQWGSTAVSSYPTTINFPTSFSDRNYTFTSSWNSRNVGSTSDTTANERPFTSDSSSHAVNLTQVWVVSSGVPQSVGYLDWYATGRWTDTPYDNSTITVGGGIPSGAIVPFNKTSCPVGWTLADGSNGTPDLRGIFIRGSGTNSILKYANGSYFSSTLGTYANDSFQGHWHYLQNKYASDNNNYYPNRRSYTDDGSSQVVGWEELSGSSNAELYATDTLTDTLNGEPRTGAETTPAYYSTIYCVKMTEDTADSNTIWATSGNNVLLSNSSMNVNITSNLSVQGTFDTPAQPIISGRIGTTTTPVAPQIIPFDEFWVSQGITYNSGTRRFTVPVDGIYRITIDPFFSTGYAGTRVFIGVNTDAPNSTNNYGHAYRESSTHDTGSINSIVRLNASDYIVFYLANGALYNGANDRFNQFSIEKIA